MGPVMVYTPDVKTVLRLMDEVIDLSHLAIELADELVERTKGTELAGGTSADSAGITTRDTRTSAGYGTPPADSSTG